MDQLIELAERLRPGLQQRLATTAIRDLVQGALLEVDRYWYYWSVADLVGWPPGMPFSHHPADTWPWVLLYKQRWIWKFELRPPDWDKHCAAMGYGEGASPVVIRVVLRRAGNQQRSWPHVFY